MKKGIATLILLATVYSVSLLAGNETKNSGPESAASSTLSMVVKDKLTGEPLAGVLITIGEIGAKAYTNLDGTCQMYNIPAGKYNISTSYVSYNEKILKEIKVSAGEPASIEIDLTPAR